MSDAGAQPPVPAPLSGVGLWVTAIALALGTFMQVLDSTIANVSLPAIAGNLGASTSQGAWVITSFAVANGVSVPLTGWLMVRYGVVRTFLAAVLAFTAASLLCGLAWNLPSLIFFRLLQGAVSGPMIPGSQALLLMIFPPARRGMALAIWSMTTMVAPVFGPLLGGYISDSMSWRWIFLINVPVGLACAWFCRAGLAGSETATRKLPIDTTGFMLLLVWVGALQVMLDLGKEADWFASPAIVVLGLTAVIGFAAWLIWELGEAHPIVDLSLFRSRNFTLGVIAYCVSFAVFFGNNVLLPVWLQTQMGYGAAWAGLVMAPSGVIAFVLSPLAARMLARMDARWPASIALVAFAVSYYMRSLYSPDADFWALAAPMVVQGVAMAVFFLALLTIILNGVPAHQVPQASGLSNFSRTTLAAFVTSLTTTMWDRKAAVSQTRMAETMGATDPAFTGALDQLHAAGVASQQALGGVTSQVVSQAYLLSSLEYFRLSAWLALLLIPCVWLTRRTMASGQAGGGE